MSRCSLRSPEERIKLVSRSLTPRRLLKRGGDASDKCVDRHVARVQDLRKRIRNCHSDNDALVKKLRYIRGQRDNLIRSNTEIENAIIQQKEVYTTRDRSIRDLEQAGKDSDSGDRHIIVFDIFNFINIKYVMFKLYRII